MMAHRYNFEIGKISEMLYQLKSSLLTPDFDRATQREILEDTHRLWLENNTLRALLRESVEDATFWMEYATTHMNAQQLTETLDNYSKHAAFMKKVEGV
jgi:regulator of replication initiation timing